MSVLLSDLPITKLLGVLDLESSDSSYCDVRDRNRHGQQHIDCLAIIFSGALNDGKTGSVFSLILPLFATIEAANYRASK